MAIEVLGAPRLWPCFRAHLSSKAPVRERTELFVALGVACGQPGAPECVCACVSKARGAACKNTPREKVSTEIRLKENVIKHREHPVYYSTFLA